MLVVHNKMTPAECFAGIDWTLLPLGINIYYKNKGYRTIQWILFTIFAFKAYTLMYFEVDFFLKSPCLFYAVTTACYCCGLITQHIIWWNQKKIRKFFDDFIGSGREGDKKRLRRVSFAIMTLNLTIGLITAISWVMQCKFWVTT